LTAKIIRLRKLGALAAAVFDDRVSPWRSPRARSLTSKMTMVTSRAITSTHPSRPMPIIQDIIEPMPLCIITAFDSRTG
jgi:hypothetical protein